MFGSVNPSVWFSLLSSEKEHREHRGHTWWWLFIWRHLFLFTEGEIFWCVLQEGGSLFEAPSLWFCLMIVNILQKSFQCAWKSLSVSESSKMSLFCTLSLWMSWVSPNAPLMENSSTASSVQTGFLLSGVPYESWWGGGGHSRHVP